MSESSKSSEITVILAEDDDGHAELVIEKLREAGVHNEIIRFHDGQETLDFFLGSQSAAPQFRPGRPYLLLLDIRMPKVDGVEVLEQFKAHPTLRNLPIIMVTTTDDPREVKRCHDLGCNVYITKPVGFQAFADALRRLGLFILVIKVPGLEK